MTKYLREINLKEKDLSRGFSSCLADFIVLGLWKGNTVLWGMVAKKQRKEGVGENSPGTGYTLQRHAPSDLLLPVVPHLQ